MGERRLCKAEVGGSSPPGSTKDLRERVRLAEGLLLTIE